MEYFSVLNLKKTTEKLEMALNKIKIKDLKVYPNSIKVFDNIKPLDLLNKLDKAGITIDSIRTNEANVEDYYLELLNGGVDHE